MKQFEPEPTMTIKDWMAALQKCRRSIYNDEWIMAKVRYVGGSPRWYASDLTLYLATRDQGVRRRPPRTKRAA